MDSLQEAIEKARQEREGQIGKTPAAGEARPSEKLREQSADSGTTAATAAPVTPTNEQDLPLPSQVRYSSTRKVDLKEDSLVRNRVIATQTHDPRVETFRQLRSQVLANMKRNNWRTLAMTSAYENAGKTLTAVNLAISISQEVSQTVMLVDLDLRTPSVHTTLDIDISKGIVDHLHHDEPLANILINPGLPRLVLLPCTPQGRQSSEVLSSPEMQLFLEDVTGRYKDRIIIFDLPPLLRNDDAMVFLPQVDACLLVVEDGVTTPEDIERCQQLLKHSKLLGTVLNKTT